MARYKSIVLVIIVILAAFLRFWQLGVIPPALTWDEVAWGYNAYSIGIDGKDEFGRFLPLDYLESFGDFKPPVYAYLDIIPIKIFGLTEFAVRFPSALFGTLTVLITYFLVKRIFPKEETLALLSAFFLAISPWHINLSRVAFEANVATFFLISGVWLFLAGVQSRKWLLLFSVIFFVLSTYTFNTSRVVAPLLVLVLTIGFYKSLLKIKKQAIITAVFGVLLLLPSVQFYLSPQAKLRFNEVNIFSDIDVIKRTNQQIANDNNSLLSKFLHNRRFAYGVEYLRHYFDNLTPKFLFIKGDGNPKFSTQDIGQLYLWELPFFIAGILFIFRQRKDNWWIVPAWLIIAIIPAATARETPHALRIETTLPTFQIFVAIGVSMFLNLISNFKFQISNFSIRFTVISLFLVLLIFNITYYVHGYYAHYPREYSGEWQYGYRDVISYIQKVSSDYDTIVMTTKLGRPYAYFLFYTKTDPEAFRQTSKVWREPLGFVHVDSFGKYVFTDDVNEYDGKEKKVLYINTVKNTPDRVNIMQRFQLLNGEDVLTAYTK